MAKNLSTRVFNTATEIRQNAGAPLANALITDLNSEVYWDKDSVETDDGLFVFKVTGQATGRWKKVFRGKVRAVEAGIKSDGTSQTTAFASLLSIARVDEVFIDDGDIVISGTLTVPSNKKLIFLNNAKLVGSGTVIINGSIQAASEDQQIFANSLTVKGIRHQVSLAWFGAIPDFLLSGDYSQAKTDNLAALNRAKDSCVVNYANTGYNYAGKLYVPTPATGYAYYVSGKWEINASIEMFGLSNQTTFFIFAQGVAGIYLPFSDKVRFGQSCYLHDFGILGNIGNGASGAYDNISHGITINSPLNKLERLSITNFRGNGILLKGNFSAEQTNAFLSKISDNNIRQNSGDGIRAEGADVGLCRIEDNTLIANARFGIRDMSTIGLYVSNNQTDANGTEAAYQMAWVKHGGREYRCIKDDCVAVEPGVTAGWQTWWEDWRAETIFSVAWSSSVTYQPGGCYAIDDSINSGAWYANYTEQGAQFNGWNRSTSKVDAGNWRPDNNYIGGDDDGILSATAFKVKIAGDSSIYPAMLSSLTTTNYPLIGWIDYKDESGAKTGFGFLSGENLAMIRFVTDGDINSNLHIAVRGSQLATWLGRSFVPKGALILDQAFFGINGGTYTNARHYGHADVNPNTFSARNHAAGDYYKNVGSDLSIIGWRCIVSGTPGTWVPEKVNIPPTEINVSSFSSTIISDVSAITDTWTDILTHTIASGLWKLTSAATAHQTAAGGTNVSFRLIDTTNNIVIKSGTIGMYNNGQYGHINLNYQYGVAEDTVIKLQVRPLDNSNLVVTHLDLAGDINATTIDGIRIGDYTP